MRYKQGDFNIVFAYQHVCAGRAPPETETERTERERERENREEVVTKEDERECVDALPSSATAAARQVQPVVAGGGLVRVRRAHVSGWHVPWPSRHASALARDHL